MKKAFAVMVLTALVLFCIGCAAHRVNIGELDVSVINRPLPENVTNRTFYPGDASLYVYNMPQLVGSIMICDNTTKACSVVARMTKKQTAPTNVFLQDRSNRLYRSVIDNKFGGGVTSQFITLNLADNRKIEVTIDDSMCLMFNNEDTPYEELGKAYEILKIKDPKATVYWVQGAILMTITKNYYDEINDNATITAPVFSVNGKVFMSKDEFIKDQRIAIYTMDLARIIPIASSGVTKSKSWDKMMIGDLLRTPVDINELTVSGESARIAATIGAEQVPSFVTVIPKAAQIQ